MLSEVLIANVHFTYPGHQACTSAATRKHQTFLPSPYKIIIASDLPYTPF